MYILEMVNDALNRHASFEQLDDCRLEESPNEATQSFYNLLVENQPVFEGVTKSKLSIYIRLLACKFNWNVPNQALDCMAKIYLDLTPSNNSFPNNYYEAKRLVSKIGFKYKKIDCCVNGYMCFYDNDSGKNNASLLECKFYGQFRYHTINPGRRKKNHSIEIHVLLTYNSKLTKNVCFNAINTTHDITL